MTNGRRIPYHMRYYDRRRPCHLCSRPLVIVSVGPNRGKFAAAVAVIGGYERYCHLQCLDFEEIGLVSGDEILEHDDGEVVT